MKHRVLDPETCNLQVHVAHLQYLGIEDICDSHRHLLQVSTELSEVWATGVGDDVTRVYVPTSGNPGFLPLYQFE